MKLAIIGTAGRRSDILHLNKNKYEEMIECAKWLIGQNHIGSVVSGGAAWADHVALKVGLPLSLWLPAKKADLVVAEKYHATFSRALKRDTWGEVLFRDHTKFGGFKDRNSKVAEEADCFLAMTFRGDGGTFDTISKMRGKKGWHLCLWSMDLTEWDEELLDPQ